MEIRPLAETDLPLVAALSRRIWPVAYAGILTSAQIENILARIYSVENLKTEMADGHCFWAAYEGGEALGFASGYRDGAAIWIKKLYVLSEAQGRGIGQSLIETVIAAFGPASEVRLLVNSGNIAAQAAYERLGFIRAATLPVTMGDYEFTDYLYVKSLCR
jgi:ribosomal protein S18 acetylase RimI-like enzyme